MPNATVSAAATGLPSAARAILPTIEDPISQAIWKLTALNLIVDRPGMFVDEDECNAVFGLVYDALDFVKDARETCNAAWEKTRGGPPEEEPSEPTGCEAEVAPSGGEKVGQGQCGPSPGRPELNLSH